MRPLAFLSRRPTVLGIAAVLFAASLSITTVGWGDDDVVSRASLKGIEAVFVKVQAIRPDAEQDGLTQSQTQTDVESRLRQAGITVDPRSASGYLYVNVNTLKNKTGFYAVGIQVEFRQPVTLTNDPSISCVAATWSVNMVGYSSVSSLSEARTHLADIVDMFINAYREQNPKK